MRVAVRSVFTTVKTEGAILPADLLQRIADGRNLDGLRPADYHLAANERLNEAINRAWSRLLGAWVSFRAGAERLSASDSGTTLTRERWLLILFQELGFGRLSVARGLEVEGVSYPISHLWERTPIHLVTFRQDLDRRGEFTGAVRRSPHSLMQEFLNRSEGHLWGFVSNGLRLRLLRDNASLTRAAYVEFDLESMMQGELYAEFALLWLVCHQSRVEAANGDPSDCWLERWSKSAAEQGTRALDALRQGVQEAIEALGRGYLAQPANTDLRERLKAGSLSVTDYNRQLLRLVYRLIFLCVAEDRDLLLLPAATPEARRCYNQYYSVRHLRDLAGTLRGGPHADLYRALRLLLAQLRQGYPPLGLPALGSFLFSEHATPDLDGAELANEALLACVRALTYTVEKGVRRPVDYRNLGVEELGSVYESLLELHPQLNVDAATFALSAASGSERKTTGSYYTPAELIRCLLDSALEPVVEERLKQAREMNRDTQDEQDRKGKREKPGETPDPSSASCPSLLESSFLSIRVCDPACGSGAFLIAAAHRLARHLARIRSGDEEPAPAALRDALRDVVRHCIYGVDLNEMAVELCKVALWMETLDPGKPLSFLDANIQCGNSLIGATPELIAQGLSDEAFTPLTGDDKAVCSEFRKKNKREREGQGSLFDHALQPWERLGNLAASMATFTDLEEDTLGDVRAKQELYEEMVRSSGYEYGRLLADAWCAAFVWEKNASLDYPITTEVLRRIERNPFDLAPWMKAEIQRLAAQYRFFHWHLAFPQVFRPKPDKDRQDIQDGEKDTSCPSCTSLLDSGFDVVLGNPPWERVKLQEKEWFAARRPEVAAAPNAAARRKLIAALATEDPPLYAAFQEDLRQAEGESQFLRASARYSLCGRGDVNTYAVFAELALNLVGPQGRAGIIVPTGIATDDTTKYYFQEIMQSRALASLYDFENAAPLFPGVHRSYKFCLLTLRGKANRDIQDAQDGRSDKSCSSCPSLLDSASRAEFVFFAHQVEDLREPARRFSLTAEEIALLNPNTRTCPIFRSQRDAELTKGIYRRVPVLVRAGPPEENPWGIDYRQGLFHSANDVGVFTDNTLNNLISRGYQLLGNEANGELGTYVPLYEGRMIWHFDHRFGSYARVSDRSNTHLPRPSESQYSDPCCIPLPWYWVSSAEIDGRLSDWEKSWLIGFRDITNSTNERAAVFAVLPRVGCLDQFGLLFPRKEIVSRRVRCLLANSNAFALDYVARLKIGGTHLKKYQLYQLPVLPPSAYATMCLWQSGEKLHDWIAPRALELTYTAWDLAPFARDCGYDGPPFRWDEERRFLLRCELDAAYFHLYGIAREDVEYIMSTFPIVQRRDVAAYGEYRTRRVILEVYDAMEEAERAGQPYQTPLDPPPADPRVAHGWETKPEWAK